MGLMKWHEDTARLVRIRKLVRAHLVRDNHGRVLAACCFWRNYTARRGSANATAAIIFFGILKQVKFQQWRQWTVQKVRRVELLRTGLTRVVKLQFHRCLQTWICATASVVKRNRLMRRALAAKTERQLWGAFILW